METKTSFEDKVDISRSGRVRKKSSKLLDFQSPDEVEKQLKRLPRTTKSTTSGRVGRPLNSGRTRTSSSVSSTFNEDNDQSDYMVDDDEDDFAMGNADSDEELELDELVADIVEGVEAESFDQDNNLNESKVRSSLYMSEKSNKRKILKDGKIITSKVERKDKGKSRYTAYSLWAREFRKTSKFSKNQDLDFSNASRRLGELWANVSNKEKSAWRRKAKIQATKAKARERATAPSTTAMATSSSSVSFVNRATTSRTRKLAAERQKTPPTPPSPNSSKRKRYSSHRNSTSTNASTTAGTFDGLSRITNGTDTSFLNSNYLSTASSENSSLLHKAHQLPNIEPIDAAAHLKLLGESLSIIGERLKEHEGQIALSGSLSVLLDSILCSLGPLMCLTPFIPGLEKRPQLKSNLASTLDNIAYVMPGL